MKTIDHLFLAGFLMGSSLLFSQDTINLQMPTSINLNGSPPDGSAMLDVQATDKGMLTPRMTTAQRTGIASPATGLLVYDTDTGSFWYYENAMWNNLSTARLTDADGDTKVSVEDLPDEDIVRIEAGGGTQLEMHVDSSVHTGKLKVIGNFVSGASDNVASGSDSFSGGGTGNDASGSLSFIGGGSSNETTGSRSFVGGGSSNDASGNNSFVGGGSANTASGTYSFAGGGQGSTVSGNYSFVGGGQSNIASGINSFIGGGFDNIASGLLSFIGGGFDVHAESYAEAVFGIYDTDYTPISTSSFDPADRLFVIGNGTNESNRSNAITVLKNGRTGIGTDTPDELLEVSSDTTTNLRVTSTSADTDDDVSLQFLLDGGTGFQFRDYELRSVVGDLELRVSDDNFTTSDLFVEFDYDGASVNSRRLSIGGHARPLADNTHDLGTSFLRWREVFAANGVINTSDAREKENIQDLGYGLEEVLQLRPVSYTWKDRPGQGVKIGLVAQEVLPIIGEVVKSEKAEQPAEDGNLETTDRMGIYYSDLIPVLIKGMQEQQTIIEEERAKNAGLEERLAKIEAALEAVGIELE